MSPDAQSDDLALDATQPIHRPIPPPAPAAGDVTEIEAGLTRDVLNRNLSDWHGEYLEISRRNANRRAFYGGLRQTRRFDQNDVQATAGVSAPWSAAWSGLLEVAVSPSHNVLPRSSIQTELHRRLLPDVNMRLGWRHTDFVQGSAHLGTLAAEWYVNGMRLEYALSEGRVTGGSFAPGHRLRLDRYYGERNRVGIIVAQGREAERVGPDTIVVSRVRNIALLGQHALDRDWSLSYELLWNVQGEAYSRRGARVGLRRFF